MKKPLFIFHPITIFVGSIIAVCLSYVLYLRWYIKIIGNIDDLALKFGVDQKLVADPYSLFMIIATAILLVGIIGGLIVIFTYYQKTIQLYRLQENFINNFTHELKTPLASIRLYLETFQRYDVTKEEREKFIDYMLKDSRRLDNYVNQILQVGNLEAKDRNYKKDVLGLKQFIKTFVDHNHHIFTEGSITFESGDRENEIYYPIDSQLFEMLLMNLISNAFRYNDEKEKKLKIKIWLEKKSVFISFNDNGIGFKDRYRKVIFKKFYQLGKAENCTAKGTGLGLYLVQQITKIHDGKIKAESSGKGEGSTFTLSLPFPSKRM
ncbi:MAG: HAMP domain-containing sensor histidine kinase [Bdellovibrionota bacterium]|nr:HAMP domain-containing sensor histidine kinase [Bdellovibrionota bacterium]